MKHKYVSIGVVIILGSLLSFLSLAGDSDRAPKAWQMIQDGALLIDTRTPAEFNQQHLDGALLIPYNMIENEIGRHAPDKSAPIVVYCRSGNRSGIAKRTLETLGYTNVHNGGGLKELINASPAKND